MVDLEFGKELPGWCEYIFFLQHTTIVLYTPDWDGNLIRGVTPIKNLCSRGAQLSKMQMLILKIPWGKLLKCNISATYMAHASDFLFICWQIFSMYENLPSWWIFFFINMFCNLTTKSNKENHKLSLSVSIVWPDTECLQW